MKSIRADFDKIALLDSDRWNHNNHYHPYLLKQIPSPCDQSLDIGCGTGTFTQLLAERSNHVLGLDLSPQMIRCARERSKLFSNIEYQVADVLKWSAPIEQYDCVASIATLHHLPLETMLKKMKCALKPNGVLLVLDLYKAETPLEYLSSIPAFPMNIILRLIKTGRIRPPRAVREAYHEHGKTDVYPHFSSVRHLCKTFLPKAVVRRHLLWRYSIVWRKATL